MMMWAHRVAIRLPALMQNKKGPQKSADSPNDIDIEDLINQQGCGKSYEQLEECLGEHDRDWRACQKAGRVEGVLSKVSGIEGDQQVAAKMATTFRVPVLYRHILKAARQFPSKKRDRIVEEIKVEFHQNKTLTDTDSISKQRKLAVDSLEQLEAYTKLDRRGPDWQVSLKGSCA